MSPVPSPVRKLANALLRAVLRHAGAESQEWAGAMLRELDFIENDWVALFWALGSINAIFRQTGRGWRSRLGKHSGHEEVHMNEIGKRTVGVISGVAIAALLVICVMVLLHLSFHLFSVGPDTVPFFAWLLIAGLTETAFIVAAVRLWRKRRPMAVGILLSAVLVGTHVAMYLASRWNR
jgi:hypothetical protein